VAEDPDAFTTAAGTEAAGQSPSSTQSGAP